jgi:hypothetical protein
MTIAAALNQSQQPEPAVVKAVLELLDRSESNSKMLAMRLGRTGDATGKILARSIRFAEELTQDPSQALAEDHYLVAEAKKLLTGNAPYWF